MKTKVANESIVLNDEANGVESHSSFSDVRLKMGKEKISVPASPLAFEPTIADLDAITNSF